MDRVLSNAQLHKLVNTASEALRESINLTEKEHTLQLVWTLVAEWVLETRIELWEETGVADPEFCCQFTCDLDTLRSLCHHVPVSCTYLYCSCQVSTILIFSCYPNRPPSRQCTSTKQHSVSCPEHLPAEPNNSSTPVSVLPGYQTKTRYYASTHPTTLRTQRLHLATWSAQTTMGLLGLVRVGYGVGVTS